ncbi:MAG: IS66 family insertion sequence element accessory protein TnpB [Lachnospiraceae bacterium]|nr:IS66 family insertion sequence element accessory protein TnpB [Lachnospiraceae bacterium]
MLRRDVPIKKLVVICGRTDMRKGIDSLVATVRLNYGLDPIEVGTLFLFCGRNKSRIKGLFFEGDGFCLISKRVLNGSFCWPSTPNEARQLSFEQYDRLLTGFSIDSSIKAGNT